MPNKIALLFIVEGNNPNQEINKLLRDFAAREHQPVIGLTMLMSP